MIETKIKSIFLLSQLFLASFTCHAAPAAEHDFCGNRPITPSSMLRINGIKKWYLIGNALTTGENVIKLNVAGNQQIQTIGAFIDGHAKGLLAKNTDGFGGAIDIANLRPGMHSLRLVVNGDCKFSRKQYFYRSHPLYALLTTDWDASDSRDSVLKLHEQLHTEHPGLKITHFLGPYTFTDTKVSPARRNYLANWMITQKKSFKDEIGLHIHPFCNFVNTVPKVHCRFKPSDTYAKGDSTGYTVLSSAYSEADFLRLLKAADALFIAHGLDKPISFRTGSWAAGAQTLKALAADGFTADSSANNWRRIKEESINDGNGMLYRWNRQHWRAINDRSQPYWPAERNPTVKGNPAISIVEIPDNGSLVDYVTGDEMIAIFKANWRGQPLAHPATFVFGFHPVSYTHSFHKRIDRTLRHIDRFLAVDGKGPVVYETMSNMARVFSAASQ